MPVEMFQFVVQLFPVRERGMSPWDPKRLTSIFNPIESLNGISAPPPYRVAKLLLDE